MTSILRILASPLAWLAAFSATYGLHGLLCELAPDYAILGVSSTRAILGVAFLFAAVLQGLLLALLYSTRMGGGTSFIRTVSRASGWVGLAATLWTLFPTMVLATCV